MPAKNPYSEYGNGLFDEPGSWVRITDEVADCLGMTIVRGRP